VDPSVRLAGAVVGYRHQGVEFAAQLAELASAYSGQARWRDSTGEEHAA
jgi:hypothetical protein